MPSERGWILKSVGLNRSSYSLRVAGHDTVKVPIQHRHGATGEVSEIVREVRVVALQEARVGDVAVLAEEDIAQHVIAQHVGARHHSLRL